jgi:hypothetical protein
MEDYILREITLDYKYIPVGSEGIVEWNDLLNRNIALMWFDNILPQYNSEYFSDYTEPKKMIAGLKRN